jgi:hypothetical protein
MADITMCQNRLCKLNRQCKRFISKANEFHQTYSIFIPKETKDGEHECEQFLEVRKEEVKNEKNN